LLINEASAKRFGGGRSFGMQRSHNSFFSGSKTLNTASLGQKSSGKLRNLFGGMLVGGLLASLFMGHGLASGLMSWLILGAASFFLAQFMRRRVHPTLQSTQGNPFHQNGLSNFTQNFTNNNEQLNAADPSSDFAGESFLRNAKICFIRLQTAYDQKNLQDLNSFTLPEVFAEIKMQLDERGDEPNHTEVVQLNAELLDASRQANSNLACVRFTGSIKENNEPSNPLDEIWHFRQFDNDKLWLVAGIQQEVLHP